jgi:hypothetical protein
VANAPATGLTPPDPMSDLETTYVIADRPTVSAFISEHQLGGLLFEARAFLDAAFGPQTAKSLRLVCDDEGFDTLFCLISMPADPERALEARASFDRMFWLDRCATVDGKLNFDFELT